MPESRSGVYARRFVALLCLVGFAAVAAVLLLSDRAGNVLGDFVTVITRAGRAVERDSGVNLIDRSDVPGEADEIFHAVFWASGMFLIGWISRKRSPVFLTALIVGGISLCFELAQPLLSMTRAIEVTDAVANLIGVSAGAVALFLLLAIVRRIYGDDRLYHGDSTHHRDDTTDEFFLNLH